MFDFDRLSKAFKQACIPQLPKPEDIQPPNPDRYVNREKLPKERLDGFLNLGLKAISEGKLAALVHAEGQASPHRPKGVIPLGTGLSNRTDSLLFIQAVQIARLQKMAQERFPGSNPKITWLVMTSQSTDAETRKHLDEVLKETGLQWDQVIVFMQNEIPAFDMEGNAFLASPTRLITYPGFTQILIPNSTKPAKMHGTGKNSGAGQNNPDVNTSNSNKLLNTFSSMAQPQMLGGIQSALRSAKHFPIPAANPSPQHTGLWQTEWASPIGRTPDPNPFATTKLCAHKPQFQHIFRPRHSRHTMGYPEAFAAATISYTAADDAATNSPSSSTTFYGRRIASS